MSNTNFVRKPDYLKLNGGIINFSSLNATQKNQDTIRYTNERIFELVNPDSRYSKQLIFDTIMRYKDIGCPFSFYNFFHEITNSYTQNGNDKRFIQAFKKACKENDQIYLSKLREAMIKDLKTNVVVLFSESTINAVDFYFDTVKSYDNPLIEGIKVNENGFINPNSFVITAIVNIDHILNYYYEKCESDEPMSDIEKNVINSFWAALIKDNERIIKTEKMMSVLYLLAKSNFEFVNTSATFADIIEYRDEKLDSELKVFYENYKEYIENILEKTNETDTSFIKFFDALKTLDLNPLTILTTIEPKDPSVNNILKALKFDEVSVTDVYASSKSLSETTENEELNFIKKTILIGRILPLVFVNTYYFQDGKNYIKMKEIDDTLEAYVHEGNYRFSSINGTSNLNKIHFNNDAVYDELRSAFKNPLKTTGKVKNALKRVFAYRPDDTPAPTGEEVVEGYN